MGFSILELSKLIMLKAHYGFFKRVFGDKATLLFTDTDSLCYHIVSEDALKEMLASKEVLFDLAKALEEEDYLKYTSTREDAEALKQQLKEVQGKLGALKLENGTSSISEFVGLASKMCTLLLIDRHHHEHGHMKGKGVPSKVLETQAGHEAYKKMVVTPYRSTATFSRFQSKNHVI